MTHPQERATPTSQQPADDNTQPMFAVAEATMPRNRVTAQEHDTDEITDQLDNVSGGLYDMIDPPGGRTGSGGRG